MKARWLAGAAVAAVAVMLLVHLARSRVRLAPPAGTYSVVASFYPLFFFAEQIAGDRATVVNVTPPGVEPHDYEPTASDLARLAQARLIVLNGAGLEPWGPDVETTIDPKRTVVVRAADGLASLRLSENGEDAVDPHVWLAPPLARRMVARIAQGFRQVDPGHAADYAADEARLDRQLADLDASYHAGLAQCATRDVVTSHAAFGYVAAAYGLHQVAIAGLSPDAEPSTRQLADIVRFAKAHHVTTIFFERLISPKLSDTVATEIGARTMVLDPLEGLTRDEIAAGSTYFSIMRQNLANLEQALGCTR